MGSEDAAHKKGDLVPRKLGRAQRHDSLSTLPRRRGKALGLPEEPPRRVGQNAVNRPAAERVKQRLKGAPGVRFRRLTVESVSHSFLHRCPGEIEATSFTKDQRKKRASTAVDALST